MAAPDSSPHPYAALTPDRVLDAIESVGLRGDGRLQALGSYENRVYLVGVEDAEPVVAKFYRPQRWSESAIVEEQGFVGQLAEREIPVVAPLALAGHTLHTFAEFHFAIYPRCGGRAPELDRKETLEWMGRFLGRIHSVGALTTFAHRPALDPTTFGLEPRDWLLAHDFIPPDLRNAWQAIAAQALDGVARCYARAGDLSMLRLHGDCHAGNVLWIEHGQMDDPVRGPHFVDFDDARMGPAAQDLWMLLSGDRAAMSRQLGFVLAGYEDFFAFDRRELHLVEALRTLRLLHYSAWLAQRWDDPAFPAAFPWFNTQRYWQDRILELREQVALMDEPPLEPVPA
jgi:Ser/Thr protein kinase RdoA (MazF antagonist)